MTLPSLRPEQHAQILGYSIIGYGLSFLINLIDPFFKLSSLESAFSSVDPAIKVSVNKAGAGLTDYFLTSSVFPVLAVALCLSAGLVIKKYETNPKPLG